MKNGETNLPNGNKMTEIKSKEVKVNQSAVVVFDYLNDMQNFIHLLPQDKISEWKATADTCSFKVQNAATIELIKDSVSSPNLIKLKSGEKSPFPFTLDIHINDEGDTCSGYNVFNGKLNAFMRMVAEKPLAALFNHMADKLVEIKS